MSEVLDSHGGREAREAPRAVRHVRRVLPDGGRPSWWLVLLGLLALSAASTAFVAWRFGGAA